MQVVGIIDYGVGNLFSVRKACEILGYKAKLITTVEELAGVNRIILPGVGAYSKAMAEIRTRGFDVAITEAVAHGAKVLGICLGMQLLLEGSSENGWTSGLGLIKGKCVRFNSVSCDSICPVPQIQWNKIIQNPDRVSDGSWLKVLEEEEFMYFVHSYYADGVPLENVVSFSYYAGVKYASTIRKGNVYGCQYHPEKSSSTGLKIYSGFMS